MGLLPAFHLPVDYLTGKFDKNASFDKEDHRNFNRNGEAFDKGETFSGIDFDRGLKAVEELKKLFPEVQNLAPIALQWILKFPEVSCTIPGASKEEQLLSNLSIYDRPELSNEKIKEMNKIYDEYLKQDIHHRW